MWILITGLKMSFRYTPPIELTYNWNIVENGVKHHTPSTSNTVKLSCVKYRDFKGKSIAAIIYM
jgi:hypothetical protein